MSEKKSWTASLRRVFVVRDDEVADGASAPAPAGAVSQDASPPDAVTPGAGAELDGQPPPAAGGKLDFASIYAAAGIDAEEQARVAKAAELLQALPEGSEPARHIVEASLKAFGVPIERIIAAGEKEIRALDGYVEQAAADTRKTLAEGQQRIAQLEQEIQRLRQAMEERTRQQQEVERACAGGKLQLARVLGFFGHEAPGTAAAPGATDSSDRGA